MTKEEEIREFANLVENNFDKKYLRIDGEKDNLVDLIRQKKRFPIKWLVSEIDKKKLTKREKEILSELTQKYL